mmetsp:Transcript_12233/g.20770  ORF Transcript_12233/g.20770 Transcript_12233/m.20770 type:complete len:179 (+) Transcript_12233:47-583(+)
MKINTLTAVSSLVVLQNATAFAVPPLGQNVVARSSTTTALAMGNPIDGLFAFLKEGKVGLVKSLAGDYDAAAVQSKMDKLISDNNVLMFSFTTCPFCIKAKETLDEKGAKYTVVELDQVSDGKAIRAVMGESLGRTSVPAIWIKGTFIGGCNDGPLGGINTLNSNNQLDGMLKAAGAI